MTTASLIDLRTHAPSGEDLQGLSTIAQQLLGEPYLFARRSYSAEQTFHFGTPVEYTLPEFGNRKRGSLVLSARGSAWLMKSSIWPVLELELPKDWRRFRMPPALQDRLQDLLDHQDRDGKLSRAERREARALTKLVDMLSLMKLRALLAAKRTAS